MSHFEASFERSVLSLHLNTSVERGSPFLPGLSRFWWCHWVPGKGSPAKTWPLSFYNGMETEIYHSIWHRAMSKKNEIPCLAINNPEILRRRRRRCRRQDGRLLPSPVILKSVSPFSFVSWCSRQKEWQPSSRTHSQLTFPFLRVAGPAQISQLPRRESWRYGKGMALVMTIIMAATRGSITVTESWRLLG